MESNLSCLSSLKEEDNGLYVQPHYKEAYRLAIYALLCGGKEAYEEFLRAEQINHFLSEQEIEFMLENAELPVIEDESEGRRAADDGRPSTYFPIESDEEVPDLELGWPEVNLEGADTSISLLFHPPRQNTPSIKEVVRKQIQEARQIVAVAMDIFTDVDIFKELISATLRGVMVYILLDETHVRSFFSMSQRVGINVQDLKNLRVRTVRGQQYQCRSGIKFHGGLEQKFILVDCQTVIYGTYSYTWSFEKINLSMVLVVTGQLVCSYDEEFRRLYARSTVLAIPSKEWSSAPYMRDALGVHSPNSSQITLSQINKRSRVMPGMRSAHDDRFNAGMLTRGLSVQERLHQSHCPDIGTLVRGHSYGGELQKLNTLTRLRMGTKDIGAPFPPERNGFNTKSGGDLPLTNRLSQQHMRHQSRYGADHNLIPFNSETSLHRWKMDAYFNESDMLDGSCEAISPLTSPYSSHTGLNEYQSQLIHSRSRDMKSRVEEMRQKRLSLQEYSNLRQSQESLRSMYPAPDRSKFMPSLRGLDARQSAADVETNMHENSHIEDGRQTREGDKREQILTTGHRSASHNDIKNVLDHKTSQAYDWQDSPLRSSSAVELDTRMNEAALKLSQLQSNALGIQHPRVMESLTEIPEEKEGSNSRVNSSDPALKDKSQESVKVETPVPEETSERSVSPAESKSQDQSKGSHGSIHQVAKSKDPGASTDTKKSASCEAVDIPPGSPKSPEAKSSHTEKEQTQREEAPLQRKSSIRRSFQRKGSSKSKTDHSQSAAAEQTTKKSPSSTKNSPGGQDTEKHKSPFLRLSSQRSSKKKAAQAAEQDHSSSSTLDEEGVTVFQARREKAYSRFEYFLTNDNVRLDKALRTPNTHPPEKDKSSSLSRQDSSHQGQSGNENKLGRFMQRVGNLISKNK
ncbi:unnamed protein product [Ophioblennius macclurei]